MGTTNHAGKKAIGGSIHRIREFELEKVNLASEFDILQIVGEGWFGKILLAEHRATGRETVLKALPKPYTALRDFYREFHYSLHLGAHRNIITTHDVAFETAGFYVFSQEYAPLGDLTANVSETGIGELHAKRVAKQIASALEHLNSRDLVHRDVKLDNVLVLRSDFSRVKLCDFGETRRAGTLVRRRHEWLPYSPPEVLSVETDNTYKAETSHDVWQFAIVVFVCLTGCLPWQKAAADDPRYSRYNSWRGASGVTLLPSRRPKLFKLLTGRAQRLMRTLLDPRPERRPSTLSDLQRYLDDRWLVRSTTDRGNDPGGLDDGLCPSMYSFHSSADEKNKLLATLSQCGIETTVDRGAKKERIIAWVANSSIQEDNEDEDGPDDVDVEEDDEDVEEERAAVVRSPSKTRSGSGPTPSSRGMNGVRVTPSSSGAPSPASTPASTPVNSQPSTPPIAAPRRNGPTAGRRGPSAIAVVVAASAATATATAAAGGRGASRHPSKDSSTEAGTGTESSERTESASRSASH